MKKIMTFSFVLLLASLAYGQDYISALENSMERSKGATGAKIIYMIHQTPTVVKAHYSTDFDSGELVRDADGRPLYFELTKSKGEEKEVLIIQLSTVSFVEFEISYPKGNCEYKFDFYY